MFTKKAQLLSQFQSQLLITNLSPMLVGLCWFEWYIWLHPQLWSLHVAAQQSVLAHTPWSVSLQMLWTCFSHFQLPSGVVLRLFSFTTLSRNQTMFFNKISLHLLKKRWACLFQEALAIIEHYACQMSLLGRPVANSMPLYATYFQAQRHWAAPVHNFLEIQTTSTVFLTELVFAKD